MLFSFVFWILEGCRYIVRFCFFFFLWKGKFRVIWGKEYIFLSCIFRVGVVFILDFIGFEGWEESYFGSGGEVLIEVYVFVNTLFLKGLGGFGELRKVRDVFYCSIRVFYCFLLGRAFWVIEKLWWRVIAFVNVYRIR